MPERTERWGVPVARRHPDVRAFLAALDGDVGDLARRLDRLVHAEVKGVLEGMKWKVPFFFLDGPLCYLSPAQRHVTFGLARGIEIDDASGLLTGTGRSPIAKATLRVGKPLPEDAVRAWLREAVRLDGRGEG